MRRLVAAALGLALLAPVAAAEASIPSYDDRLDAKRFARDFWAQRGEFARCYGVRFRWRNYSEDGNVRRALAYTRDGSCVT